MPDEVIEPDETEDNGIVDVPDNHILGAFHKEDDDDDDEYEDGEEGEEGGGDGEDEEGEEEGSEGEEEGEDEGGEEEEGDGEGDDAEETRGGESERDALDDAGEPLNPKDLLSQKVRTKVNDEVGELTIREVLAEAQRAQAADKKFQVAAENTRKALEVIEQAKVDPLAVFYNLVAKEKSPEVAHQQLVQHCREFLGKEMEWLALPPEEQARRRAEAELARSNAEIERLRLESNQESQRLRQQLLARQIYQEAESAGLPNDRRTLMSIAQLFDAHEAAGKQTSIKACVKELVDQEQAIFRRRLMSLPEEEIRALRTGKADKNGRMRPGRAMRVRKRRNSGRVKVQKAEPEETEAEPEIYATHEEAWAAAQKKDKLERKQRRRQKAKRK